MLDTYQSAFGLFDRVQDQATLERAVARFRERRILLPSFTQLAEPHLIDPGLVAGISPDSSHPANLFRVHWHNDSARMVATTCPGTSRCQPPSPGWKLESW